MLGSWWKVTLLVLLSNLLAHSVVLKTISNESRLHKGSRSLSCGNIQSSVTVSDVQMKYLVYRQKRSFLFPNGVKLCPEETISQAIGNYLKYYKLRVCQEAVWEAFKMFWDRLPARHEHEAWMNVCDQGIINIFDIGVNFSQSDEYQALMKEKLSLQTEIVSSSSNEDLCILETTLIMNATSTESSTREGPDAGEASVDSTIVRAEESEITAPSDIEQVTKKLPNQVLEFIVQLVGENYTKALSDPATMDYQKLADDVNTKMENVFGKFPGYQTINILEFRKHLNSDSSNNVAVHYTVTFDGNTPALQNETLNLVDVNLNKIEDDLSFEGEHQLTAAYTLMDFKNLVIEALHKENLIGNASLTFNPETLQLMNERSTSLTLGGIKFDPENQETEFADKEDGSEDSMLSTEELLQSHSTVIDLQSDQTTGKGMSEAENTPVILTDYINPVEQQNVSNEKMPSSTMNVIFAPSVSDLSPLIDIEMKGTSDLSTIQITTSDASDSTTKRFSFESGTFSNYESRTGSVEDILRSWATVALQPVFHDKLDNESLVSNSIQFTNMPIFDDIIVDYPTNVPSVTIGDLPDEPPEILVDTIISNEIDVPLLNDTASYSDIGVEIKPHIAETVSKKAPVDQLPDSELELTIQTSEFTDVFNYYSNDSTLRAQPFTEHAKTLESIEESVVAELPVTELSTKSQTTMDAFVTEHLGTKSSTKGSPETSFIKDQFTTRLFAKGHIITELDTAQQEMLELVTMAHTVTKSLPTEDMVIEQPTVGQLIQDSTSIRQFITASSNMQQLMTDSLTVADISTLLQATTESILVMQPFGDTFSISQSSLDSSNGVQSNTELFNDLQPFPTILAPLDTEIANVIATEWNNPILPNTAASTVMGSTTQSKVVVQGFGVSISEHNVNKSSATVQAYSKSSNSIHSDDESIQRIHMTVFSEVKPANKTSIAMDMTTEYFPIDHHDSIIEEHNEIQPPQDIAKDKIEMFEVQDISNKLDPSYILQHREESDNEEMASIYTELPVTVPTSTTARESHRSRQALVVFFSLRVTNMIFSDDLFNKSSHEYKALEQQFLELLVPYLQSNLTDFKHLEILNFRNGSIIVNSRMKFAKPVPQNVTNAVYLILDDFCNTAYQTMNLAIDRFSLDVESGNGADPCKFQACNEHSECLVNHWTGESECVCNAGYMSVDDLPCQSICDIDTDFCLNDGKCDIIPGQGAICRCRVGENWWYRGEHCEEYVSETLVVAIAFASVAGFLLVASAAIFCIARTLRAQYAKSVPQQSTEQSNSLESVENGTKYNPMYESDATTSYSHYNKRYPQLASYSSGSAEASANFSSDEIRHIYEHSELSKEEIQDRLRIIDLYAKDRQFAEFVRQHQIGADHTKTNPTN